MKKILSLVCFIALPLLIPAQEATHSIGFGVHYWRVVEDIDIDDLDSSGTAWIGAYRYDGGLLALHAELEVFPSDFGTAEETVYAPQAAAILGDGLYGGVGIGLLYSDGEFANSPFYFFRAGFNIRAFGPFVLDLNANYVFTDFDNLSSSDIDSDTITLGAMLRYEF